MKKNYSLCGIKQDCCQICLNGICFETRVARWLHEKYANRRGKWHQQLYCQIHSKWICNIVHGHHKWIFIEMCKSKSGDSLWHYSQICTNQELLNTAIRCCWEEANWSTFTMLITFDFLCKLKRKYNAGCGDTKYAQTEFASEHIVHNGVLLNWNCQARIRRCLGLAAQIKVHIYSVCYAHILFKLKWKQKYHVPCKL